jgi:carboxypeptidase PM20D1
MKRCLISLFAPIALVACGAPDNQAPAPVEANATSIGEEVLANRLAEAIRVPTVSRKDVPDHNAEAFATFRAWMETTYPRTFATLKATEMGHGSVWLTLPGRDTALAPAVFLAHQDVVPVEPGTEDGWTYPAFDGTIADGYVWGRGAIDMKGHLVTLLTAMETLLEEGYEPVRTLHLGLTHDEEVGGLGAQAMAAWLEARGERAWFVLDEGGSMVLDMPLTDAPAALVGVAEKGFLTVEVTARARGGHSSSPPDRTAVGLLGRAIVQIEEHPFEMSLEGGPVGEMLMALSGDMDGMQGLAASHPGIFGGLIVNAMKEDDAPRAMLGTTIAPTVITGGVVENVLPQEARALINLRLHPRTDADAALDHLRSAVADLEGVTVEPWSAWSDAPPVAATQGPAWDLIAGAAASHAPEGTPVAPMLLVATTDSRAFAGVAENLYRYSPARIEMDDLSRIHGTDERMRTSNLPLMVSYFRTVLAGAGDTGAPD